MKERRQHVAIFLFFLIGMVAVYALVYPFLFVHDSNLRALHKSFQEIKHPTGTTHIVSYQELGLLAGNSNHCDYFVAEMRNYSGSKKQIINAYKRTRVWNPMRKQWFPVSVA